MAFPEHTNWFPFLVTCLTNTQFWQTPIVGLQN